MNPMHMTVVAARPANAPADAVVVRLAGDAVLGAIGNREGRTPTGDVDEDALSADIQQVKALKPSLVVADMSNVSYLASPGIAALLRLKTQFQQEGTQFRLAGVTPLVFSLLQRCRLETAFSMYAGVDEALA